MRKLSVFIAASLDGYIAKPGNDLSFLGLVEKEGEDYGYAEFMATIDTIILGRKTYDWVLSQVGTSHFDNMNRDVYVVTRTKRPNVGKTTFYTGNLIGLVQQLKSGKNGKNIYCDGGAETIHELLKNNLIDEFIISVIPVLLGSGIALFKEGRLEQRLKLFRVESFDTGLVQLHYSRAL
ncbi:dihydrofolate reductase family protein [Pedobacter sp. UBA4863]|uniref:dihydrofolate reductase family protein n=1 Tax=Pedobacter sp. UBA4863 TaxID=1947060 RepID=UPI0025F68169|nr:dihydrofolate reductase family protein [Pedobacter sp. UBA4863]